MVTRRCNCTIDRTQSARRGAPREAAVLHFLFLDVTPTLITLGRIRTRPTGIQYAKSDRVIVPDSGVARATFDV